MQWLKKESFPGKKTGKRTEMQNSFNAMHIIWAIFWDLKNSHSHWDLNYDSFPFLVMITFHLDQIILTVFMSTYRLDLSSVRRHRKIENKLKYKKVETHEKIWVKNYEFVNSSIGFKITLGNIRSYGAPTFISGECLERPLPSI